MTLLRRFGAAPQAGSKNPTADAFAATALSMINKNLDAPSLPDIQALCLLILHEWGNLNAVRAYIFLGQAARMLQMHRIINHPPRLDSSDKFHHDESLRRTIWLLYIIDCFLTSTPDRRSALDPADYASISLPCQDVFFVFGNASYAPTLANTAPKDLPANAAVGEVGELGFIVIGTTIWRDVVHYLTTLGYSHFPDTDYLTFMDRIHDLRKALPVQYVDKPQQINLHITMGTGFTFAMVHSLIHCSQIFLQRRRLLDQVVPPQPSHDEQGNCVPLTPDAFERWSRNLDVWRRSPQSLDFIQELLQSCHTIISLLNALDAQGDKDSNPQFPIYMLFAAFSASATVAYLALKNLTPRHMMETATLMVGDGLGFMSQALETLPLAARWHRHLDVMKRILSQENAKPFPAAAPVYSTATATTAAVQPRPHSARDDVASHADSHADPMDYEAGGDTSVDADGTRDGSEPPMPLPRRTGVTTISGNVSGITGASTPVSTSPPSAQSSQGHQSSTAEGSVRIPLPSSASVSSSGAPPPPVVVTLPAPTPNGPQDMNAAELCAAFEKQLLELDDLASFMGGGVPEPAD